MSHIIWKIITAEPWGFLQMGTSYIGEMNGTNLGKTPFGYINRNGETVIDIKYYNATDFYDDGYAVVATASETYHQLEW